MGAYGTSIGFAGYMTTLLLWSTYLGVMTGEWRQAKHATVTRMRFGVAVILVSYGIGAASMGAYGTSIGFAGYMTTLLLWSTYLGVMTGEWRQAKHATVTRM